MRAGNLQDFVANKYLIILLLSTSYNIEETLL